MSINCIAWCYMRLFLSSILYHDNTCNVFDVHNKIQILNTDTDTEISQIKDKSTREETTTLLKSSNDTSTITSHTIHMVWYTFILLRCRDG